MVVTAVVLARLILPSFVPFLKSVRQSLKALVQTVAAVSLIQAVTPNQAAFASLKIQRVSSVQNSSALFQKSARRLLKVLEAAARVVMVAARARLTRPSFAPFPKLDLLLPKVQARPVIPAVTAVVTVAVKAAVILSLAVIQLLEQDSASNLSVEIKAPTSVGAFFSLD